MRFQIIKDAHCITVKLIYLPGLNKLEGDVPKSQVVVCVVEVDPDAYSELNTCIDNASITPVRLHIG